MVRATMDITVTSLEFGVPESEHKKLTASGVEVEVVVEEMLAGKRRSQRLRIWLDEEKNLYGFNRAQITHNGTVYEGMLHYVAPNLLTVDLYADQPTINFGGVEA